MTAPRSAYLDIAGVEIHVTEWGDKTKPALVMWHGLARTGRDFDEAARALSDSYFVLCPDTPGRGLSAWARDPVRDYCYRRFGEVALLVLDRYGIGNLRWVGTSMGGLLGVTLAAGALRERMSHLVINDIGPEIPEAAIDRIAAYVGNPEGFSMRAAARCWPPALSARVDKPWKEEAAGIWSGPMGKARGSERLLWSSTLPTEANGLI